jgi:hypothetical protein
MNTIPRSAPTNTTEKEELAKLFVRNLGIGCFVESPWGYMVTLEEFDVWIIDQGFAEDPGCDESEARSQAWRGFVAQRNTARGIINDCGHNLPEPFSFSVEVYKDRQKGDPIMYHVRPWQLHVKTAVQGHAQKIMTYAKNKGRETNKYAALADSKEVSGQDTAEIKAYLEVIRQSHAFTEEKCIPLWQSHEKIEEAAHYGILSILDKSPQKLEHDAG